MSRRILLSLFLLTITATRAHAQIVVIDPGNLVQTVLIAERTLRHYEELQAQYRTILRMGQGLGSMDRFRVPGISITRHDPSLWQFGRPWIEGLNSGDASGAAYAATALPLLRPDVQPSRLTASARRDLERRYATIEITDTVAMRGGHQVALVRGYHDRLQEGIQGLRTMF